MLRARSITALALRGGMPAERLREALGRGIGEVLQPATRA
jgi:hypothetical protein